MYKLLEDDMASMLIKKFHITSHPSIDEDYDDVELQLDVQLGLSSPIFLGVQDSRVRRKWNGHSERIGCGVWRRARRVGGTARFEPAPAERVLRAEKASPSKALAGDVGSRGSRGVAMTVLEHVSGSNTDNHQILDLSKLPPYC